MSVFCGTRLLLAFGFRGCQCNHLHQRNIASLGLASLFQVTTRRDKCFNTSIAPLNRCGIFKSEQTITVQLFSTGLLSCSENQSGLLTGDASTETRKSLETMKVVKKWPAPGTEIRRQSTSRSIRDFNIFREFNIFIGGTNFNYEEEYIRELFSQFGTVSEVRIKKRRVYDPDQFHFGFISFEKRESVLSAMAAEMVTARNNAIIVIKKVESKSNMNYRGYSTLPEEVTESKSNPEEVTESKSNQSGLLTGDASTETRKSLETMKVVKKWPAPITEKGRRRTGYIYSKERGMGNREWNVDTMGISFK